MKTTCEEKEPPTAEAGRKGERSKEGGPGVDVKETHCKPLVVLHITKVVPHVTVERGNEERRPGGKGHDIPTKKDAEDRRTGRNQQSPLA